LLVIIGAVIGVLSTTTTWLTSDELQAMKDKSGSSMSFPDSVVPNLSLVGLCDSGWIFSQDVWFALSAFLFFAGTILAFYTSLGGLVQIAGFFAYFRTFDSAQAAVISNLPSAVGPKIALVSILLVMTGLLFPVFIWSKVKLKSIWRRPLTITAEKNVKQMVPIACAAIGSALVLWGLVVGTSSVYEKGTLSEAMIMAAGLILLGTAMFALIMPWKTE